MVQTRVRVREASTKEIMYFISLRTFVFQVFFFIYVRGHPQRIADFLGRRVAFQVLDIPMLKQSLS